MVYNSRMKKEPSTLELIERDNRPRYESLIMYFDMIGVDFNNAIKKINSLPRLWYQNPNNLNF